MTLVSIPRGILYPYSHGIHTGSALPSHTVDATAEKIAMMGRCYISGRPTGSKTISAAGGGSISFMTGTVVWGNNSSTLDIGIQDVDSVNGPPARPDGTFDVKRTYTSNTNSLSSSTWTTVSMTGGSGSKSITHGDLIAVVFDMTLRNSTDSVIILCSTGFETALDPQQGQLSACPGTNFFSGSWGTTTNLPNVIITFDDGTIGCIDGGTFISSSTTEGWSNNSNPDERGNIFQVPFNCKIDALCVMFFSYGFDATNSDFTMKLYSDPTGTPTSMASAVIAAKSFIIGSFYAGAGIFTLASEVSLTRNTDYCIALKGDGSTSLDIQTTTLGNTAYRALLQGGTSVRKGTRNNSTGAFTAESPAVTRYGIYVRISAVDDGMGTNSPTYLAGI